MFSLHHTIILRTIKYNLLGKVLKTVLGSNVPMKSFQYLILRSEKCETAYTNIFLALYFLLKWVNSIPDEEM